ncbi:hydantoinase B/oxoprolinase family protein [Saccharopolyspora spinosa]|uniref:hydantoinase B/oxoprolinase family protein n=1 Tax=Saccharopolyspora spinosa TaxID=60894 RepID=UPI0037480DC5
MAWGAQPDRDGLDCAGMMTQVNNMLPDVEMNEMLYPVLYLWKQLNTESAGHGAHRGGLGLRFAWTLHGAGEVTQTVFAPNAQVVADGFGGGLPGGGSGHEVWRQTDVARLLADGLVPAPDTLSVADRELLEINQQSVMVRAGDVFVQWIAGGGGYGDPLLRAPQLVAADVRDGYVTGETAQRTYGVIVTDGTVDEAATRRARTEMRQERLGSTPAQQVPPNSPAGSSAPRRDAGGWYVPASGARLGTGEDWRGEARKVTYVAAERLAGYGVRVRPRTEGRRVLIDEFYSPSCGTLLEARVRVAAATS